MILADRVCPYCNEPILDGEPAFPVNSNSTFLHTECMARSCLGSVGHQQGQCSCFDKEDTSEIGLTLRQAAKAAYEHYQRKASR